MLGIRIKSLFLVLLGHTLTCEAFTPIVIWHGIADTCCNNTITGGLQTHLQKYLPGSHVVSLQIGNSSVEDYRNSLIMHPDQQVEIACDIIKSDPLLADGYNAVGFSQGSQFLTNNFRDKREKPKKVLCFKPLPLELTPDSSGLLYNSSLESSKRGLVQRCPEPQMKTLITMAGQHQGVYGIPGCDALSRPACDSLRQTINSLIYLRPIQKIAVPATYWHNPLNERVYKRKSSYLADINNERFINQTYIRNLQSLEKFVMVKHLADEVVQPIESSWFGFYKEGQSKDVESLQESELYTSDRLGLRQMDKDGKLHFLSNTWVHAELDWPWFRDNIVDKYLK